MPQSPLRLIEQLVEFVPKEKFNHIIWGLRGLYVLYEQRPGKKYNVVYIGLSRANNAEGIRFRLRKHSKSKRKLWTHFSVFKVWDNIRDEEIVELEGLFRHIYRDDLNANKFNLQRGFKKLRKIRKTSRLLRETNDKRLAT